MMATLILWLLSSAVAQPGVVVFLNNSDNYHTFRIPNLCVSPGGALLAFAEGRARLNFTPPHGDTIDCYGEGASAADWKCTNKDIVLRRSLDNGATWGRLQVIAQATDIVFYTNPQGLAASGAVFLLFMRCVAPTNGGNAFTNCTTVLATSMDDGASWPDVYDVPPGAQSSSGGFGGVVTSSGRLVFSAPSNSMTGVLYSDDHGATWHWGAAPGVGGENQVAEGAMPGELLLTVRRLNNTRVLLRSSDNGDSWGPPALQNVTDPNCQASMIRVTPTLGDTSAGWLLFSNPHTSGLLPYALGRQNVTVQASSNWGLSWQPFFVVDAGPSAYSTLAQISAAGRGPASCGVLYEESADLPVDFRSIRFVPFDCAGASNSNDRN